MKWIKASERLPDIIRVCVKYKGDADIIYNYNGRWAFDNSEGFVVFPEDWEHIEWLDESDLPNEPSIDLAQERIDYYENKIEMLQRIINQKPEPSIQEDISVWEDFANEFEQLQRMEENTWEWNKKILQESYKITRLDSQPQPLQEDGLEEAARSHASLNYAKAKRQSQDDVDYIQGVSFYSFKAGAEYIKQLNK